MNVGSAGIQSHDVFDLDVQEVAEATAIEVHTAAITTSVVCTSISNPTCC